MPSIQQSRHLDCNTVPKFREGEIYQTDFSAALYPVIIGSVRNDDLL